jgi:dTDP-4-dehydrorhamnose reductase
MTVLVIGAAGQLGSVMAARLGRDHDVTAWTRETVDLRQHAEVRERLLRLAPQVIINCASFNNVDQAEDDQQLALDVNAWVVQTLARAAAELDALLLHFSTDFVFGGTATMPYAEEDQPEPQSVYAQSKLIGEWMAADAPRHYVLRVESLFGGATRRSSVDRIADAVRSGGPAPVFHDRVVSPSFVSDVADASAFLLGTLPAWGTYHCVNTGHATWYEVGQEIARHLGQPDSVLQKISVADVVLRASRPQFAALSNRKLAAAGFDMPTWQDAMRRYLAAKVRA